MAHGTIQSMTDASRSLTPWLFLLLATALPGLTGCRKVQAVESQSTTKPANPKAQAATSKRSLVQRVGMTQSHHRTPRPQLALGSLANTPIGRNLQGFRLGKAVRHKHLALHPITTQQTTPKTPLTIDESFKRKRIRVTESGYGNVPEIAVRKRRSDKIFIMTGEMFLGAKQDRISKHDLLLPRRAGRFKLPVYCVEQGRWRYNSQGFRSGHSVGTRNLRRTVTKKWSQSAVWQEVRSKNRQVNARTSTQTMAASYRSRLYRRHSPGYLRKLGAFAKKNTHSVGYIGMIRGKIASIEIFANAKLFRKMWPKLLKALTLDAIDPNFKGSRFDTASIPAFLNRLPKASFQKTRTPGIGREYLIAHSDLSGTLLLDGPTLVHLNLFPEDANSQADANQPRRRFLGQGLHPRNLGIGHPAGLGNNFGLSTRNTFGRGLRLQRRQNKARRRPIPVQRSRRHIRILGRIPVQRPSRRTQHRRPRRRRAFRRRIRRFWQPRRRRSTRRTWGHPSKYKRRTKRRTRYKNKHAVQTRKK